MDRGRTRQRLRLPDPQPEQEALCFYAHLRGDSKCVRGSLGVVWGAQGGAAICLTQPYQVQAGHSLAQ